MRKLQTSFLFPFCLQLLVQRYHDVLIALAKEDFRCCVDEVQRSLVSSGSEAFAVQIRVPGSVRKKVLNRKTDE